MTEPKDENPRGKRNNSDDAANAIPEEGDLSFESGNDWLNEEDAIDRLLRNDGFDMPDETGQTDDKYAIVDDFSDFDERNDYEESETLEPAEFENTEMVPADSSGFIESAPSPAFIADAKGALTEEDKQGSDDDEFGEDLIEPQDDIITLEPDNYTDLTEPEEIETASNPDYQDDDFLLADFDIASETEAPGIDAFSETEEEESGETDALTEQSIEEEVEPESYISETAAEIETEQASGNRGADADNAEIALLDQFKAEQKKLIKECENKVKKAAFLTYAALGLGIVALCAVLGVAWMVYKAQTEVSKLTALVAVITEDMGSNTGETAGQQVNNSNLSIEQLNDKVDELIEQLKVKSLSTDGAKDEVIKEEIANAATKQEVLTKPLEHQQTKTDVLEVKKPLEKSGSSTNLLNPITADAAIKPETINKPADARHARNTIAAVKKSSSSIVKTAHVKKNLKKSKKAQAAVNWSVNLVSFKQQWYAKSKADEFAQKGIPVEVIEVEIDNATWYRLRVNGFSNKEEAASYAARVKKALNLSSVWVGNI
ncbi:MAG: SPOR domain-containing protein [Methylobacter sp.]|nr:SPOR domain-containing protein [Methylobacter sp.]